MFIDTIYMNVDREYKSYNWISEVELSEKLYASKKEAESNLKEGEITTTLFEYLRFIRKNIKGC